MHEPELSEGDESLHSPWDFSLLNSIVVTNIGNNFCTMKRDSPKKIKVCHRGSFLSYVGHIRYYSRVTLLQVPLLFDGEPVSAELLPHLGSLPWRLIFKEGNCLQYEDDKVESRC